MSDLPETTIKYVKHTFTKKEMEDMQKKLAVKTAELRRKEEEKKAITSQFGSAITQLETETLSLADSVNTGYEHRSTDCKISYNWKKGTKDIVHPDTGEVIETIVITDNEKQMKFPVKEKDEKKKKKDKK